MAVLICVVPVLVLIGRSYLVSLIVFNGMPFLLYAMIVYKCIVFKKKPFKAAKLHVNIRIQSII